MNPNQRGLMAFKAIVLTRLRSYWPKWVVSELPGPATPDIRPITDEFVGKDLPL